MSGQNMLEWRYRRPRLKIDPWVVLVWLVALVGSLGFWTAILLLLFS